MILDGEISSFLCRELATLIKLFCQSALQPPLHTCHAGDKEQKENAIARALCMKVQIPGFADEWHTYDQYALGVVRNHEVCRDLLESAALKRLDRISFLGGIDFFSRDFEAERMRFTRFVHSIGVAYLASKAARRLQLSDYTVRVAVAAALLHDVGHGAFSHSIEPFFSMRYGVTHKHMTRRLVEGDFFIGFEISEILHDHRIEPWDVIKTISGEGVCPELFSGPMNIDTFDGISRASAIFEGRLSDSKPDKLIEVFDAATTSRAAGDEFWRTKHRVYNDYIMSPYWAVYDAAVQDVLESASARVSIDDYLMTDLQFSDKFATEIAAARRRLKQDRLWAEYVCEKISKKRGKRNFVIDDRVFVMKLEDLSRRYQEKHTFDED